MVNLIVTKSLNFFVSCIITTRASYICITTDFGTGRSFSVMAYLIVTESVYFVGYIGISAMTGVGSVSLFSTRRICYKGSIGVT